MLFDSILKGLDRLLNCSKYLLMIKKDHKLSIKARYDDGISYCIPLAYKNSAQCYYVEKALIERTTLRLPGLNEAKECQNCPFLPKRPIHDTYLMIVPLMINESDYGAIAIIDNSYNSMLFTDDSQRIVELFANQVTIAISQTQLREQLQEKNAKINKEIKMAGIVQQSLLPITKEEYKLKHSAIARVHINNEKLCLTGFYSPCTTLGGDFYDFVESDDVLNITIADVSGHGLSSSLITALYKMALHKFVTDKNALATNEVCSLLNTDLCKFIKTGDYITAFLAFFDKKTNNLMYSSAGHPYPMYYNSNENAVTMIEANGLPFAMIANQKYPVKNLEMKSGDKLLLYTDGITEAVNANLSMFKKERLVDTVRKYSGFNSSQFISKVFDDVLEFTQSKEFPDDISMLLLEMK